MVDIVIPCHNAYKYSRQCVKSIIQNTHCKYKIIIVDNGSTDETKDWSYIKVRNEENLGFPKAINQGIESGDSEYICILNNDTIVTPYWLTRLLSHIENKKADIVSPCSNYVANRQMVALDIYKNQKELDAIADKFHEDNKGICEINEVLVGFCMLFKRDMIKDSGLFDEGYGIGNSEDFDFCMSAKQAGYKSGVARDVFIHHFGSVTFALLGDNVWQRRLVESNTKRLEEKWGKRGVKIVWQS